ncbi:hypothetical protein [Sinorhizobium sp. BG8]|uniref:hypothetical protein n=1 Tax=Sinorhizobium sp. BG8 TaxID=2613773 RepID=UPI00193E50BC|nr:hypothetical protein [Sinorhizobium sp. BG8]QRM56645.1 hypothetical protein F3Y30_20480 [Sinorhizobium sp. BG8]
MSSISQFDNALAAEYHLLLTKATKLLEKYHQHLVAEVNARIVAGDDFAGVCEPDLEEVLEFLDEVTDVI